MIFDLIRCLRPETTHFYELSHCYDTESEEYRFVRFLNGDELCLSRNECEQINIVDSTQYQSWNEVSDEESLFMQRYNYD